MNISKELQNALDRAQAVQREREQLRSLIQSTSDRIQAIEVQLRDSLNSLATLEVETALSGSATTKASMTALKQRQALSDEQQLLTARLAGLRNKLQASELALIEANDALVSARSEFVHDYFESFSQEYRQAAEAFIPVVRRGAAFGRIFGADLPGLYRLEIPRLFGPGDEVTIAEAKLVDGNWQHLIPPQPQVEPLVPIAQACAAIDREAETVRKRRAEEERLQREKEREASQPAFRAVSLPVTPHSVNAIEAQERNNQQLRDEAKSRARVEVATMFPDAPERRGIVAIFPTQFKH